jgi:hypothetical protein
MVTFGSSSVSGSATPLLRDRSRSQTQVHDFTSGDTSFQSVQQSAKEETKAKHHDDMNRSNENVLSSVEANSGSKKYSHEHEHELEFQLPLDRGLSYNYDSLHHFTYPSELSQWSSGESHWPAGRRKDIEIEMKGFEEPHLQRQNQQFLNWRRGSDIDYDYSPNIESYSNLPIFDGNATHYQHHHHQEVTSLSLSIPDDAKLSEHFDMLNGGNHTDKSTMGKESTEKVEDSWMFRDTTASSSPVPHTRQSIYHFEGNMPSTMPFPLYKENFIRNQYSPSGQRTHQPRSYAGDCFLG